MCKFYIIKNIYSFTKIACIAAILTTHYEPHNISVLLWQVTIVQSAVSQNNCHPANILTFLRNKNNKKLSAVVGALFPTPSLLYQTSTATMKSVLELFEGESQRKQTFINDLWIPFSCGLAGFGMACFINWTTRRPVMSGTNGIGVVYCL